MPSGDVLMASQTTASSFRSSFSLPDAWPSQCSASVLLPPLSVLSDRHQLQPSPGVDTIAREIASGGFDVGWHDHKGILAVSPVGRSRHAAGSEAATSCSWEQPLSKREKAPSFLTFTTKSNTNSPQRPQTSSAAVGVSRSVEFDARGPVRPSTSLNSMSRPKRFSFAARSAEVTLEHPMCAAAMASLNAAVASRNRAIPSSNLQALTEPSYQPPSPSHRAAYDASQSGAGVAAAMDGVEAGSVAAAAAAAVRPDADDPDASAVPDRKPKAPRPEHRLKTPAVQNMTLGAPASKQSGEVDRGSAPFKRTARTHPMSTYQPSRAQSLVVFYHLDHDNNGKVTLSELEDKCVALGFSAQQSKKLFDKLDIQRKGFINSVDWGSMDCKKIIELVTLLYMRKFMGLPDTTSSEDDVRRYFRAQEVRKVKNLAAAINLVRVNAVSRGARANSNMTGNVIYEAFRFLDTDKSGSLTREELRDGFGILGVHLADSVTDEVMDLFDTNKSGTIEYYEFIKTLFPKSLR